MFGMFFLTLCFYSFLLSTNLKERRCFLVSSLLTLIILKLSPTTRLLWCKCFPLSYEDCSYLATLWSTPLSIMLLETRGQPDSLNSDLPHYLEDLPSCLQKGGCTQAAGRMVLLGKITYSRTLWEHQVSQLYQNKSLHLSRARILGIYRAYIDKDMCSPRTG